MTGRSLCSNYLLVRNKSNTLWLRIATTIYFVYEPAIPVSNGRNNSPVLQVLSFGPDAHSHGQEGVAGCWLWTQLELLAGDLSSFLTSWQLDSMSEWLRSPEEKLKVYLSFSFRNPRGLVLLHYFDKVTKTSPNSRKKELDLASQ